jgi:glycosyltransferase involved in cell wall biosynthesis
MTIKVAMIAPVAWRTPPRHYGPWELVTSMITEGLVEQGLDVTLFATSDSQTAAKLFPTADRGYEEDDQADAKVLEYYHLSQIFERADEFDIIHNNFDFMPLVFSRLIKTPMVTTIHGFSSPKILKIYEKYNATTDYVSISNADRAESLDYSATIYHGIDLKQFTFNDNPEDYILYFGRIHHDKGTREAIRIAKKAGKRLLIAGIIQDQEYYQKYIEPELDDKQIIYLGPAKSKKRDELLRKASCLIHPINFAEPFGLSIIEAMACGTPVIAYPRGAMPELIRDGLNGFLPPDEDGILKALDKIADIDRKDCRKYVEEEFSISRMVSQYIEVYEKIIARNK